MWHRMTYFFGIFIACAYLQSQEEVVDKLSVPLSMPGQEASVELSLMNGNIHVSGYSGETIEIVAKTNMKKVNDEKLNKKGREGMFHISAISTALEVEEENNKIEIETDSQNKTVDVYLKVPYKTSLKLSALHSSIIDVDNVTGELEIDNHHGSIQLTDISGSVVANTHHGEITVSFKQIDAEKPMSFSSYHKDIDVTFPAALKANVKFKTDKGEVFSDYEIIKSEEQAKQIQEKSRSEKGKYRVRIERAYYGKINGGGSEIQFNSYHGDILIRKGE
ncbi:DUF4097 family beta strand repeat-containing protein [bacterium]